MFKADSSDYYRFDCTSDFRATYLSMTASYHCLFPLSDETQNYVTSLTMRDTKGNVVDVPCTLLAASLIRHYESGILLTLWVAPRVIVDDETGDAQLVPLCLGAVPAKD